MTKRRAHLPNKENVDTNTSGNGLTITKRHCRRNTVLDPAVTTPKPVSRIQQRNSIELDDSPQNLFIDTTEEVCLSELITIDNNSQIEPVQERAPARVDINQSNTELSFTQNRTPVIDRSIERQSSTITRTPLSASRIVVSVDRRQRESNEDITCNRTSNTPVQPRHNQIRNNIANDTNNSYSIDLIPSETYDILSRFPEFRQLVKAFNNEKKKCLNWSKDFARLQEDYNQLKANSFPRPPAVALNYLVDLVTSIQHSSGRDDPRSDEQIARDLGENKAFLDGLRDVTPQQTALNIFNHLYPGYETKTKLDNVKSLENEKPDLLRTILTFSQRSSPGTNYKMQDLRDTLNNSIRGARFHWKKLQSSVSYQTRLHTNNSCDQTNFEEEYCRDRTNESSNNTDTRHNNETADSDVEF